MQASLVLIQPDGGQRDVPVKTAKTLIGRNTDCGIRIPSSAVSRHHCEIVAEDDMLSVRDLGSSNGTYVNKVLVKDQQLFAGDVVSVGPATFVVRVDGEPAHIDVESTLARANVGTSMDAPPPPSAAKPAPRKVHPAPGASPSPAPAPTSGNDDSDEFELGNVDNEDSSVFDFDFKDDDDAPKL